MNKYLLLIFTVISYGIMEAQVNAVEWANLKRYEGENTALNGHKPKVLFLGNSITEGWVMSMPDFFIGNDFVGRGISGQTSSMLLLRFRQDVVSLKPKLLIINIGTNDIAENTGPYLESFTLGNISSMVDIAKANGIKVILSSVLPAASFKWRPRIEDVSGKIMRLNSALMVYAKNNKIAYLDYHTPLKNQVGGLNIDMAPDGVHPTPACYQIMADLAMKAIQKQLK